MSAVFLDAFVDPKDRPLSFRRTVCQAGARARARAGAGAGAGATARAGEVESEVGADGVRRHLSIQNGRHQIDMVKAEFMLVMCAMNSSNVSNGRWKTSASHGFQRLCKMLKPRPLF
jgi:hypothetical protein